MSIKRNNIWTVIMLRIIMAESILKTNALTVLKQIAKQHLNIFFQANCRNSDAILHWGSSSK